MKKSNFKLEVSAEGDLAYLELPDHPGTVSGVVHRTVSLREIISDYQGADIHLDFDSKGNVIGLEIIL